MTDHRPDPGTHGTETPARPAIGPTQIRIAIAIALGVATIAGIGFAGSYTAVTAEAVAKGFGWFAHVLILGVDIGIAVFFALDLFLTWLRIPFPLLRPAAWLLTAATITFNAAVSWPDPIGVSMHAVIPVLFVIAVEAARHTIGRLADIEADRHIESPPLIRWLISPWPTYRIWRQMRLWHLRSYSDVIEQQKQLKVYRARLRADYGRQWRREAPAEKLLVFQLARFGTSVSDALAAPEVEAEVQRRAEVERRTEAQRRASAEAEAAREAEAKHRAEAEALRIREAEAEAALAEIARQQRLADTEAEDAIAAVEARRRKAFQEQQAAEAEAQLAREREALQLARDLERAEAEALRAARERARLEAETAKPKPSNAEAEPPRRPKPKPGPEAKPAAPLGGKRAQVEAEVQAVLDLILAEGYGAVGLERVKEHFGLKHGTAYDRLDKARNRYRSSDGRTGTDG